MLLFKEGVTYHFIVSKKYKTKYKKFSDFKIREEIRRDKKMEITYLGSFSDKHTNRVFDIYTDREKDA